MPISYRLLTQPDFRIRKEMELLMAYLFREPFGEFFQQMKTYQELHVPVNSFQFNGRCLQFSTDMLQMNN